MMYSNDGATACDGALVADLRAVLRAADPIPPELLRRARAAFDERRRWDDPPHSGIVPPPSPPRR